jgi:hypothetical protein
MQRLKNLTHGQWLAIGLALGTVGGLVFDNLGMGVTFGLLFGMIMGRGKPGDT